MCEFCEESAFTTIIESTELINGSFDYDENIRVSEMEEVDKSVVFEMRNGNGYIRLINREDCNCLEHGQYNKINYCFNCGRKLGDD